MSALDELLNKSMIKRTQLEWAILVTLERGGEATAADAAQELAKKDAELAALRRVAEAARKLDVYWSLQNPDDEFWGDQFDQDLSFAVREYDKCRAE